MKTRFTFHRIIYYAGVGIIVALVISLIQSSSHGLRGSDIFSGIALLLALGAILYLRNMQAFSEREIWQRITKEYSPAERSQILEAYRHLKVKELEGLFLKILDDANGDSHKVMKLTSIAENIGWAGFLENHW